MWAAVFRNPDRPSTSNLANPLAPIGLFTSDLLFCFVVFILYVVKSSILHDLCHGEKLIGIQNSGLVLFLVFSMWFAGLLSLESSGCLSSKARNDVCNHPSNPPLDEFLPRPVVQSLLLSYWCRKEAFCKLAIIPNLCQTIEVRNDGHWQLQRSDAQLADCGSLVRPNIPFVLVGFARSRVRRSQSVNNFPATQETRRWMHLHAWQPPRWLLISSHAPQQHTTTALNHRPSFWELCGTANHTLRLPPNV